MASLLQRAGIGTVLAIVAVVITYFIGDAISGPLMATQPGAEAAEEVLVGNAIAGTVVGGVVGTILAFIASRFGSAVQLFTGLCVVGLVLYGIMAFDAAEETATGFWLNVMHLAAALPIVGSLTRWLGGIR